MDHVWVAYEADCAQVGRETFHDCQVCGVSKAHDGTFTFLGGLNVHFSTDCRRAQEEIRFYLTGRIDGLGNALEGPDSEGREIVGLLRRALQERRPNPQLVEVLRAVQNIVGRPAPRDVQRALGF